jgi:hypothetical protein
VAALAAEAQLAIADYRALSWTGRTISWGNGSAKDVKARGWSIDRALGRFEADYLAVERYETPFTVAARVRLGDLWHAVAIMLASGPIPGRIVDGLVADPTSMMVKEFERASNEAVAAHLRQAERFWLGAAQYARDHIIDDEWARRAAQRLHDSIDAKKYPAPAK